MPGPDLRPCQLPPAQPAAVFVSAGLWAGCTACSSGVRRAVVPQHASGAAALLSRVSASALTLVLIAEAVIGQSVARDDGVLGDG